MAAPDSILQFRQRFEALAGKVRLAKDNRDAARTLVQWLVELGAKSAALGDLPDDLAHYVEAECAACEIALFKPPHEGDAASARRINETDAGIGWAAFAVAEAGALVETAREDAVRQVSTLPRIYIGLLSADSIVETLDEAAPRIDAWLKSASEPGCVTFISGPSRSGDIGMRLTLGVHGPQEACAILIGNVNAQ